MSVHQFRQDTPGTKMYTHLNNAGASMPPQIVVDTLCQYTQQEALRGGYELFDLRQAEITGFHEAIAQLLNCKTRNVAFVGSATDGFSRAMYSIPFEKGDVIITTMDDYVANQISYLSIVNRLGLKLIRVPNAPEGGVDVEAMEKAIKEHNPRLVSVSHIPTNSGLVQPVEAIGQFGREYDFIYLVDACQSAGQMSLDVNAIGCDFLMSAFRKWMRGPRGAGFLYVSDRLIKKGFSPMCMDGAGAIWSDPDEYQLVDSAKRYQFWELNFGVLLAAKVATEYALKVGLKNIEKEVKNLASYTRTQLSVLPKVTIQDKGVRKSGIVTASFDKTDRSKLQDHLVKNNINVSFAHRQHAVIDMDKKGIDWALRVSPHYYNTKAEINQLISCIKEVL